jgi:glycerate kinase
LIKGDDDRRDATTMTTRPITGGDLECVASIDLSHFDSRLRETTIIAACDVRNPLLGPNGASRVYGPQKGAVAASAIESLERGLGVLARLARDTDCEFAGAGAAGGAGFGLVAFAGANAVAGIDLVFEMVEFRRRIASADLVLTGEGRFDSQTAEGKVIAGVVREARRASVPVCAIVGAVDRASMMKKTGRVDGRGIDFSGLEIHALTEMQGVKAGETFRRAEELIALLAGRIVRERM